MTISLKYAIPHVAGRGAGLGNELIPWARSFVVGTVLGARTLPPAFGLNKRNYSRHFNTSKVDWLAHRALRAVLPCFEFTEQEFYKYGGDSLADAIRQFGEANMLNERSAWVVSTQGMWGGYRHVIEAREFVRSTLYLSQFAAQNLAKIKSRLKPGLITVGMHVRLGDFKAAVDLNEYRGKFNVSLPLQWYINIAKSIVNQLSDRVQFLVVSDGSAEQLAPLLNECNAIASSDIPDSDVSDMLALANADLLVCSVSSYSAWAAFLSSAPYLWFEPNLQTLNGHYSVWGHEARQQQPDGYTKRAIDDIVKGEISATPRGWPIALDGAVPAALIAAMVNKPAAYPLETDFINYGVVPLVSTR